MRDVQGEHGTHVSGWTVEWLDGEHGGPGRLEFQSAGVVGYPTDGDYKVELASDHRVGENDSRVRISQTVAGLCALDNYTLSYDHRMREGNDVLETNFNGTVNRESSSEWTTTSLEFKGVSNISMSFAEVGPSGTLGSLLDNVNLSNKSLLEVGTTSCPELDVKPQSNPNGVNLCKSNGVIPIAFVGRDGFDPYDYQVVSVWLSSANEPVVGKGKSEICVVEDVVDGSNPEGPVYDGYADLVCHIPTEYFGNIADTATTTDTNVEVCVQILPLGAEPGSEITLCAPDELKLTKLCPDS